MNLIDLKERIATSEAFSVEERDFLLRAINMTHEWLEHEGDPMHHLMRRLTALRENEGYRG